MQFFLFNSQYDLKKFAYKVPSFVTWLNVLFILKQAATHTQHMRSVCGNSWGAGEDSESLEISFISIPDINSKLSWSLIIVILFSKSHLHCTILICVQFIISPLFLAKFSCHSRRSIVVSFAHSVISPIILKGSFER